MKKFNLFPAFALIAIMISGCGSNNTEEVIIESEFTKTNDSILVYNFEQLEPLLQTDSEKIHIVNFWAMWCVPCVKEMPFIEAYARNNEDVELLFVSLDFPKDIDSKLKPFLEKKNIQSRVVLLDDADANTWINKIDPNWSGSIPFTIAFNKEKRVFFERPFDSVEEFEKELSKTFN